MEGHQKGTNPSCEETSRPPQKWWQKPRRSNCNTLGQGETDGLGRHRSWYFRRVPSELHYSRKIKQNISLISSMNTNTIYKLVKKRYLLVHASRKINRAKTLTKLTSINMSLNINFMRKISPQIRHSRLVWSLWIAARESHWTMNLRHPLCTTSWRHVLITATLFMRCHRRRSATGCKGWWRRPLKLSVTLAIWSWIEDTITWRAPLAELPWQDWVQAWCDRVPVYAWQGASVPRWSPHPSLWCCSLPSSSTIH